MWYIERQNPNTAQPYSAIHAETFRVFTVILMAHDHLVASQLTVKPVYSGHLGTNLKCPDFPVSLHVNGYVGTITKCPDYGSVPIFKGPN